MSGSTWPPEPGVAAGSPVPAAVLAPLFVGGEQPQPHLVLTRRRADLRRHAGEIAFPGGRRDAEDASLEATALREAEEEVGLAREAVTVVGALPTVFTFATGYVIHPFVASIPPGVAWRLSPREVDAVLELPLAAVAAGRTRTRLERRGISFETDAYVVEDHLIWGATARIIELLLEQLDTSGGLALRQASPPPA